MYTYEEHIRAVRLYIKIGKRVAARLDRGGEAPGAFAAMFRLVTGTTPSSYFRLSELA
ncbi:hypothetical protein PCO31110_04161 [Pandoraea communis]|uniref:Uncharacterized protein n=1 Tax=Pandoraea communis TaxID=2508297 RepID=A0A5E4XUS8_9BURK|nr:hypothetical protein LMG16407_01451 [Pandoraea apista]VVE40157.1 hypothetical protein PCO31110_04161 [Pandoraea communis]